MVNELGLYYTLCWSRFVNENMGQLADCGSQATVLKGHCANCAQGLTLESETSELFYRKLK